MSTYSSELAAAFAAPVDAMVAGAGEGPLTPDPGGKKPATIARTGLCPVCWHDGDLTRGGRVKRHKELRFKASKGGAYATDVWCKGSLALPEDVVS